MWDVEQLKRPPAWEEAKEPSASGVRGIFYTGVGWRGRETRVFAWVGMPERRDDRPVPGMVLVHGGGGTAFAEWVRLWNGRGYAAIAMDTCGCVAGGAHGSRPRHDRGGPAGWGGFGQIDEPPEDQWMYHAVASVMLGHSLLASWPGVDPGRIGVTGISWGAILSCIVAGLADRPRFVAPVYGCGFLDECSMHDSLRQLGDEQAARWQAMWGPKRYLPQARMPMLWVNGTNDFAFPLAAMQRSYRLPKGPRVISIRHELVHGQDEGAAPAEIAAFADEHLRDRRGLPRIVCQEMEGDRLTAEVESVEPIARAELLFTRDAGAWQQRKWHVAPAAIEGARGWATLPADASVWFLNIYTAGGLCVSTEHDGRA